jgi:hypothetical protein
MIGVGAHLVGELNVLVNALVLVDIVVASECWSSGRTLVLQAGNIGVAGGQTLVLQVFSSINFTVNFKF